jgi:hypothetical protein
MTLRGPWLLLLALFGAIAVGCGSPVWVHVTLEPAGGLTVLHDTLSGGTLNPAGVACGLVVLAAPVALIAAGRRIRLVAAVLAAAAGLIILITAGRIALDPGQAARSGDHFHGVPVTQVSTTIWPWVQTLAGLGAVVAGIGAAVLVGRWEKLSARYDAPGAVPAGQAAGYVPKDDWDALEHGQDPTGDT